MRLVQTPTKPETALQYASVDISDSIYICPLIISWWVNVFRTPVGIIWSPQINENHPCFILLPFSFLPSCLFSSLLSFSHSLSFFLSFFWRLRGQAWNQDSIYHHLPIWLFWQLFWAINRNYPKIKGNNMRIWFFWWRQQGTVWKSRCSRRGASARGLAGSGSMKSAVLRSTGVVRSASW